VLAVVLGCGRGFDPGEQPAGVTAVGALAWDGEVVHTSYTIWSWTGGPADLVLEVVQDGQTLTVPADAVAPGQLRGVITEPRRHRQGVVQWRPSAVPGLQVDAAWTLVVRAEGQPQAALQVPVAGLQSLAVTPPGHVAEPSR
jgi:hypothetical protein